MNQTNPMPYIVEQWLGWDQPLKIILRTDDFAFARDLVSKSENRRVRHADSGLVWTARYPYWMPAFIQVAQ